MSIKQALKTFIAQELLEEDIELEDDENLLVDGMVDSLGMLRLVAFIEESYSVKVPPEHFVIENFRNVIALNKYIEAAQSSNET